MKTRIALLAVILAATGCTHTSFTDKEGNKFTRTSFGTTQNIGRIDASATPDKKSLVVEGYSNEQAQVTSAAITAAISAIKP